MLSRLTILKKGLLLIAVPLCFQLAFLTLVMLGRVHAVRAEGLMLHTKDVLGQVQVLWSRMLTAHGSLQGYVITQDASFDRQTGDGIRAIRGEAAALTRLVGDNKSQTLVARKIEKQAIRFSEFLSQGLGLVRAGQLDVARAVERRKTAQDMLDAMDRDFHAFTAEEHRLDDLRFHQLNRAWTRLDYLLFGGMIASILFTVLVAVLFSRSISGRISGLADNVVRLAEGRELAPALGGEDEIAGLDFAFRRMAGTLAEAARTERDHSRLTALRAEELATLNGQLREKNQENEMFVYSVSHDLRSPLVNLQGFSKELGLIGKDLRATVDRDEVPQAVRERALSLIEVDVAESIGFIHSAVTRLSGIIDALLRLSRAGRVEYRSQEVDVEGLVRRVISALGRTIQEKGAKVTLDPLPTAYGDPTAIEQVFGNLIGNALNYLDPNRPGEIHIGTEDPSLRHAIAPPNTLIYAIRDNGLGIPSAYRSKIFTAFQRLHGDVAKGEGVGLALVRRMVERHGGRVWFESEANQGSTFFVAFPASADSSRESEPAVVSSGSQ